MNLFNSKESFNEKYDSSNKNWMILEWLLLLKGYIDSKSIFCH